MKEKETRAGRIVVAGQTSLDITPSILKGGVGKMSDLFLPGKVIGVDKLNISLGGVIFNTGLALHQFGADVRLVGKIGDDIIGRLTLELLGPFGKTDSVRLDVGGESAYTIVLAVPGFDRMFMNYYGCNDDFASADVTDGDLQGASLFHFAYPPLLRRMYQDEGEELLRLFERVKAKNIRTSMDMAGVDRSSEAAKCNWEGILRRVLPYVDFFVPSIEEICALLYPERYRLWLARAKDQDLTDILSIGEDVVPIADDLLAMGAGAVMLKCGSRGMYFKSSDLRDLGSEFSEKWSGRSIYVPAFLPDRVASSTGAGDTCIAAFLKAVNDGDEPETSLNLAAAAGACCVTAYDSLSGLIGFDEMKEKIAAGWTRTEVPERQKLQDRGIEIL